MATFRELLQAAKGRVRETDPAGAEVLLAEGHLLLDVREPDEYEQGAIPGSIHIPRGNLESGIENRVVGEQLLAEAHRGTLQQATAVKALRVLLTGPHPFENLLDGRLHPATQAHGAPHRAVDLDDPVRVCAGHEVEAVDVLGDQGVQPTGSLQVDKALMSDVGSGGVPDTAGHHLPVGAANLRVCQVHLQVGGLLGGRVQRPDALRSTEVGDAAVGRDARPSQHGDAVGAIQEGGGRRHGIGGLGHSGILAHLIGPAGEILLDTDWN